MTIKLKQLNAIKGSLAKLVTATGLPARVAYRSSKFAKAVANEIEVLEERRIALVKQYGVLKGEQYVVPEDRSLLFQNAFNEYLEVEIELPDIQIAISDLEKADLSMLDYANLDGFVAETDSTERK